MTTNVHASPILPTPRIGARREEKSRPEGMKLELLKIADERLHPSISNPNYLVLRRRRLIFKRWMEAIPGQRLAVLDIGGRLQPYRPLIQHRIEHYVALDVAASPVVDIRGNGEQLPFKDGTFDLVLATQVFEYIPQPHLAADEVYRILKPGGHLLMSVASMFPRAGDEECWRYLPAGLRSILAPFSRIEIVPEVTSIGGVVRLNACSLSIFARYDFFRRILRFTVVPVLNVFGLALEGAGFSSNDQLAGNYSALAIKSEG